jgi:hypothetical protein
LPPMLCVIEDKASGTQLIQELIGEGSWAVTRYAPQAEKVMRLVAQTATIENGFVHLPQSAAWLGAYLDELTSFPHSRHDDQVDSTAQALDWLKHAGREDGIFAYYRGLAERARGAAETSPTARGSYSTSSGSFGAAGRRGGSSKAKASASSVGLLATRTTPPLASRPNNSSSASGFLTCSWMTRASGRAP